MRADVALLALLGLGALFVCTLLGTASFAQANPQPAEPVLTFRFGNGESLVENCKRVENYDTNTKMAPLQDAQALQACFSFIDGVVDGETFSSIKGGDKPLPTLECVPSNATRTQLAKVIVKYGNDHPDVLNNPAVFLVHSALRNAFPCT